MIFPSRQPKALLRNYNKDLIEKVAERTQSLKQSNSELENKEGRLQVLLAAAPAGVLELDDAHCYRYIHQVATELVASLAEPFALPQGPVHITSRIGVALYPQHADSVEALTQCADMAMYSAKNSGKNQVKGWNEG